MKELGADSIALNGLARVKVLLLACTVVGFEIDDVMAI